MRGTSDLFGFKGYDRRVWVLFYSRLIDGVGFSIVGPFLALFMYDTMDAPLALAGLVLTVAGVAGAVGSLVGGLAADRFGRWGVMTGIGRAWRCHVLDVVVGVPLVNPGSCSSPYNQLPKECALKIAH